MAHDVESRLLVLRSMAAIRAYLDDYPISPTETPDSVWMSLPEWLADGDDCDEDRFKLAAHLGYPAARLSRFDDRGASDLITPELARRLRAVPLQAAKGLVAVALEDCESPEALQQLNFLMRDHDQDVAVVQQLGLDPATETPQRDIERLAREKPVVRIVADLITEAVARRASDIHIRPGEQGADVLYRIDDELVPVRRFMRALLPAVVSRVKVLAEMNLAEHRKPQDGRASFTLDDGRKIDLRVSVMPAVFGESVVIRLLDTMQSLWSIDQLGLSPTDRVRLDDVMACSHGMFLTTGPTGCGKSTTLYAMLLELRKQRINILTIEDPVEFYVEDIQQMQVNHDPDVIMVGEMRDRETAAIGVESALTGHLVLSTLHTNTAAATITRLLDLGIEAYLLRASLLAVMAQRLARLTCVHCREIEHVSLHIRESLGVASDEVFHVGRGCPHCEGLGVRKRRAVYELMVVTPAIQKLIVPGAEADTIYRTAIAEGMTPLTQAAVQLARSGAISLTEAWRLRVD